MIYYNFVHQILNILSTVYTEQFEDIYIDDNEIILTDVIQGKVFRYTPEELYNEYSYLLMGDYE